MNFSVLTKCEGKYISLENISVPRRAKGEGVLSIVVNVSKDFGALHLEENESQITTSQINFPSNLIYYSVAVDDFTTFDESEKFYGDKFRIYTKSRRF
ncbi:hypothetical protein [Virgibacillus sp. DJP39]|uniref:hypothetical protein n=1 Tax=Virgibacillus sp. DJP39 TaxID=3409790 RepID=UPI003BB7619D